jgi:hypothetical protein
MRLRRFSVLSDRASGPCVELLNVSRDLEFADHPKTTESAGRTTLNERARPRARVSPSPKRR